MASTDPTTAANALPYVWESADGERATSEEGTGADPWVLRISVAPIVVDDVIVHTQVALEVQGRGVYGAVRTYSCAYG